MVPHPAVNIGSAAYIFPTSTLPPLSSLILNAAVGAGAPQPVIGAATGQPPPQPSSMQPATGTSIGQPPPKTSSMQLVTGAATGQPPPQTSSIQPESGAATGQQPPYTLSMQSVTCASTSKQPPHALSVQLEPTEILTTPSRMATQDPSAMPEAMETPVNGTLQSGSESKSDESPSYNLQQNIAFLTEKTDETVSPTTSSNDNGYTTDKSTEELTRVAKDSELSASASNGWKDRLIPKSIVSKVNAEKILKKHDRQKIQCHVQGQRDPALKTNEPRSFVFDKSPHSCNRIYKSITPVSLINESEIAVPAVLIECSMNTSQNSSSTSDNTQTPQAPQPVDPQQLDNQLRQVQLSQGHQQQTQASVSGCVEEQILLPTSSPNEDEQPFPANPPSSVQEIGEIDVNVGETRPMVMPDVWGEVDLNHNVAAAIVQCAPVQPRPARPPLRLRVRGRLTAAARRVRRNTVDAFHWMGRKMRYAARTCRDIFGIE